MKHYDYIIAGAGCAGLSLLTRMVMSGKFQDKHILLVDKGPKTKNDRTWCFWETEPGFFEPVVYKRWQQLQFHSSHQSLMLDIAPYTYKMVRGIDFYNYCFEKISSSGVKIKYGEITHIESKTDHAALFINGERYTADYLFSSIVQKEDRQPGKHYLLQHFKGWAIETEAPAFNAEVATLMDFRITQQYGDCFIYTLPLSPTKAIIECTFFSKELQSEHVYERLLRDYIWTQLTDVKYEIVEEEYGIIPMTNHSFSKTEGRAFNIGTAGGNTKPSSGYTFQFIQQQSAQIVEQLLAQTPHVSNRSQSRRFDFYDTILLNVLSSGTPGAGRIFEQLFAKNNPAMVLRFLDNKTSYTEELKIITSLPTMPFLTAALKEMNIFKRSTLSTEQGQYANS